MIEERDEGELLKHVGEETNRRMTMAGAALAGAEAASVRMDALPPQLDASGHSIAVGMEPTADAAAREGKDAPRRVTLSDGGVWERVTFAPLAGREEALHRWVRHGKHGPGAPLRMPFHIDCEFTAADHRAIADVLDPPAATAPERKDAPHGTTLVDAAAHLRFMAAEDWPVEHEVAFRARRLADSLDTLAALALAAERKPRDEAALRDGVLEEAARAVESHWNDAGQMTNQRDQAWRSAAAIRRMKSAVRAPLPEEPTNG